MKFNSLIFFLFMCFLWTDCRSPSDQIKDAFKKVDESLEKSNAVLSNSIEDIYKRINSKRNQDQPLALKADTIYFVTHDASKFIDSLKQILQQKDTSGTQLDLATKLFINTKAGNDLSKEFSDIYATLFNYSVDNTKRKSLDSSLQLIKEIKSNSNWTKKYFETTPTIAAVPVLAKFKNDCINSAFIVLNDIDQRLKD